MKESAVAKVISIKVRPATRRDIASLMEMPPYSKHQPNPLSLEEDILLAESNGVVLGAVTVSRKEISYVYGKWNEGFGQCLDNLVQEVSNGWISKLYVFPEHRCQGVGTKLVGEAVECLRKRDFDQAYAGVYVKNRFRNVSQHVFIKNGFGKIGSCVCVLNKGYCRGTLLRKTINTSTRRRKK